LFSAVLALGCQSDITLDPCYDTALVSIRVLIEPAGAVLQSMRSTRGPAWPLACAGI
jgi:hypothetical protein